MNSEKYQEIIEKLGFYLRIGLECENAFYKGYEEAKAKPNFDEEAYRQEQTNPLNTWLNDVYKYLQEVFGVNHHYAFRFLHAESLSMTRIGWPYDASNSYFQFKEHLNSLADITFRLEERMDLSIRQEIAKQEFDASTKYALRYSKSRELTLNGILLARPDFMSENDQFLTFIFTEGNSWRNIPISELLSFMKVDKLSKTIHQILSDLSITGVIKEVFIPNVSTKGFEFRNPISYGFADENKLPSIELKAVRTNKK